MARILAGIQRTSLRARLTSTAEDRHDYGRRRKRVYSRYEEKRNITWWRKRTCSVRFRGRYTAGRNCVPRVCLPVVCRLNSGSLCNEPNHDQRSSISHPSCENWSIVRSERSFSLSLGYPSPIVGCFNAGQKWINRRVATNNERFPVPALCHVDLTFRGLQRYFGLGNLLAIPGISIPCV